MKIETLFPLAAAFLLVLGLACSAQRSSTEEAAPGQNQPAISEQAAVTPTPDAVAPPKVLVRVTALLDVSPAGASFTSKVEDMVSDLPEAEQDAIVLRTTPDLTVEKEKQYLFDRSLARLEKEPFIEKEERNRKWAQDASGFDFLVRCRRIITEKKDLTLGIDVEETWLIEKVKDPDVNKSWKISYTLPGSSRGGEPGAAALQEMKTHVAPARGPVLAEIRRFIAQTATTGLK